MTRHFNGWHMASILVGFFAIVIAVNLVMARYAVATFGGTVVDNSYVASQRYNSWLTAARHQDALGWSTQISLDDKRRVVATAALEKSPVRNLAATGAATHPLGRAPSIDLEFEAQADGTLRARRSLPPGRWTVWVTIKSGGDQVRLRETVR